jgi:diguanylate cyclase (GGDEF)-like protein
LSKPAILIVDDEASFRGLVVELLLDTDYEAVGAESGEAALLLLDQRHYDLVFTDLRMPGIDGVALLKEVKLRSPTTEVVMMTSHSSVSSAVEALRLGASDYLLKPLENIEGLLVLVKRVLAKKTLDVEKQQQVQLLHAKNVEIEKRYTEAKALSILDGLTGLYNRRHFEDVMTREIGRAVRHQLPLSLIFLDVDHFKHYNDRNGHQAGDALLKQISQIILQRVRSTDIVCRYGGEEITIILPHTVKENAKMVATDLMSKIAAYPFPQGNHQPLGKVTVSLGIAECPTDSRDPTEVIRLADQALYRAKQNGRNRLATAGGTD